MTHAVKKGTLLEVLGDLAAGASDAFALGYVSTPQAITWVRRHGDELIAAVGPLNHAWVYEARLFGATGDLRWRWNVDHGEWGVLDDQAATAHEWTPLEGRGAQGVRLLRGTAQTDSAQGWTRLWDGQSAPYDLPLELNARGRAALSVIEYVEQDQRHGTLDVVAERFVALTDWKGTKA